MGHDRDPEVVHFAPRHTLSGLQLQWARSFARLCVEIKVIQDHYFEQTDAAVGVSPPRQAFRRTR